MPSFRYTLMGGLLLALWTGLVTNAPAQFVPRVAPQVIIPPPPVSLTTRLSGNLGSAPTVPLTPRLTPSLPGTGGTPALNQHHSAPSTRPISQSAPPTMPAPPTSQPASQVKPPPKPGSSPPDGGDGPPESGNRSVPGWLFWVAVVVVWIGLVFLKRHRSA